MVNWESCNSSATKENLQFQEKEVLGPAID